MGFPSSRIDAAYTMSFTQQGTEPSVLSALYCAFRARQHDKSDCWVHLKHGPLGVFPNARQCHPNQHLETDNDWAPKIRKWGHAEEKGRTHCRVMDRSQGP